MWKKQIQLIFAPTRLIGVMFHFSQGSGNSDCCLDLSLQLVDASSAPNVPNFSGIFNSQNSGDVGFDIIPYEPLDLTTTTMKTTTATASESGTEDGTNTLSASAKPKPIKTRNQTSRKAKSVVNTKIKIKTKKGNRPSGKRTNKTTGDRQKRSKLKMQVARRGGGAKGQTVSAKRPSTSKQSTCVLDDLAFKQTQVEEAFHWPQVLLESFAEGRMDQPHMSEPVHIQMWTEFSGAGTPEFALEALAAATDKLTAEIISTGDWGTNPQTTLMNNTDSKTHVFGDISDVLTDEMRMLAERRVPVEVTCPPVEVIHYILFCKFILLYVLSLEYDL